MDVVSYNLDKTELKYKEYLVPKILKHGPTFNVSKYLVNSILWIGMMV